MDQKEELYNPVLSGWCPCVTASNAWADLLSLPLNPCTEFAEFSLSSCRVVVGSIISSLLQRDECDNKESGSQGAVYRVYRSYDGPVDGGQLTIQLAGLIDGPTK